MKTSKNYVKPSSQLQVGAVLIFRDDVTKEEATQALLKLSSLLQSVRVENFNPDWGSPVWYVP